MKRNATVLALFVIMLPIFAVAQPSNGSGGSSPAILESGFFQRKSITILPVIQSGVGGASEMFAGMQDQYWLEQQNNKRFDYNNIEATALQCFAKGAAAFEREGSTENLVKLIRSCGILKAILASTTSEDTLKARWERMQKRLEISAASARNVDNLDVATVMSLINGTYIGIPFVRNYIGGESSYSEGNAYWFRLNVTNESYDADGNVVQDKVEIVPLLTGAFNTRKVVALDMPTNISAPAKEGRKSVLALMNSAMAMEDFKARGTIQQVDGGLRLDIGSREGAYLDQGYKIYESRLDDSNKPYSEYMGFIRIGEIGNTSEKIDALSSAYTIIPGGFERGMSAVSHDQLFDVALRPGLQFVRVPAQSVNWFSNALFADEDADLISEDANSSYVLHIAGLYNIARYTGVTQLFVGVDAGVGILNSTTLSEVNSGGVTYPFTMNTPMILEGSIIVQKKFWFSRFSGFAELQAGVSTLRLSGTLGDEEWAIDYGWNMGIGLVAGLSFAFTPDIVAGVTAGYRYTLPVTSLVVTSTSGLETEYLKSDNESFWTDNELEDIRFGGLRFGIDVSYSLPIF